LARPEQLLKYGLWLLPALGVAELCAQLYFSQRFPRAEAWQALEPELARTKQASDLIVIAPRWAEPVARQAFGDTLMPLRDVARPDEAGYPRAIEIGARGETAPELAAWPVLSERSSKCSKIARATSRPAATARTRPSPRAACSGTPRFPANASCAAALRATSWGSP
jgi:hypothetical protein